MKNDVQIQQDVVEQLKLHPELKISEIGVCCKNGVVTLSGEVSTFAQKVIAERCAKKVSGVMAVAEDIQVGPFSPSRRTDPEIADAALNALKWNSAVQEEKIKIIVENGYVTLEGTATSAYERTQAEKSLEYLPLKGIFNLITLSCCATSELVKQQIEAAFQRRAVIDANGISVSVVGNKVVLRGVVRSNLERNDAAHTALAAPGIEEVENNIQVKTDIDLEGNSIPVM